MSAYIPLLINFFFQSGKHIIFGNFRYLAQTKLMVAAQLAVTESRSIATASIVQTSKPELSGESAANRISSLHSEIKNGL